MLIPEIGFSNEKRGSFEITLVKGLSDVYDVTISSRLFLDSVILVLSLAWCRSEFLDYSGGFSASDLTDKGNSATSA